MHSLLKFWIEIFAIQYVYIILMSLYVTINEKETLSNKRFACIGKHKASKIRVCKNYLYNSIRGRLNRLQNFYVQCGILSTV